MQKWTITTGSGSSMTSTTSTTSTGAGNKVSLARILTVRPNLNEIECWALLGQTAHALQDVLLRANGKVSLNSVSKNSFNQDCPVIYPERILASTTGRITFDNSFDAKPQFIHPLLATNQLYR